MNQLFLAFSSRLLRKKNVNTLLNLFIKKGERIEARERQSVFLTILYTSIRKNYQLKNSTETESTDINKALFRKCIKVYFKDQLELDASVFKQKTATDIKEMMI